MEKVMEVSFEEILSDMNETLTEEKFSHFETEQEKRFREAQERAEDNLIFWAESLVYWKTSLKEDNKNGYRMEQSLEGIQRAKQEILSNSEIMQCKNNEEYMNVLIYGNRQGF